MAAGGAMNGIARWPKAHGAAVRLKTPPTFWKRRALESRRCQARADDDIDCSAVRSGGDIETHMQSVAASDQVAKPGAAGNDAGSPVALDGDGAAAAGFRAIADQILTDIAPPAAVDDVDMAGCTAREHPDAPPEAVTQVSVSRP